MSNKIADFDLQLSIFVGKVQGLIEAHTRRNFPNLIADVVGVEPGKVRTRVTLKHAHHLPTGSVYCFVDHATGNILKAASYNAPAKPARVSTRPPKRLALPTIVSWLNAT